MSPGVEAPGVAKDPEGGGDDGVSGSDLVWFPIWISVVVAITGVADLDVSRLRVSSSVHSRSISGEVSLNKECLIRFSKNEPNVSVWFSSKQTKFLYWAKLVDSVTRLQLPADLVIPVNQLSCNLSPL